MIHNNCFQQLNILNSGSKNHFFLIYLIKGYNIRLIIYFGINEVSVFTNDTFFK
jgi:hypothetical protein